MSSDPQIGRVRSLYVDFSSPEERLPKRGDRLSSGKTLYYVLYARRVKRRDAAAPVRISMAVMQKKDMPEGLSGRLIRSAIRNQDASLLFSFTWHPRKRKSMTFEQYVRGNG